ncbi:MAG: DpnD/PcfM family protein [Synergistaceae bacterium]|nr:DpnD/PcfM family protein [Synergistaceae bacterium]
MIYRVAVTEIYRKVVSVEARSEREAHQRVWDAWNNTEIILDMNDFEGAEMSVLGEGHETDGGKFIEGFDYAKGTAKNGR